MTTLPLRCTRCRATNPIWVKVCSRRGCGAAVCDNCGYSTSNGYFHKEGWCANEPGRVETPELDDIDLGDSPLGTQYPPADNDLLNLTDSESGSLAN